MTDSDLDQLERETKAAQARADIAEAQKKEAEANKAREAAERGAGEAAEGAKRAAEQAEAEHRRVLAEAAQKQAEAKKAEDAATRAVAKADEQDRRDAKKSDAETRKAVAEADAASVKAFLPGPSTLKPLEGKVTVDEKSGIVAEIAAYALLERAAKKMAESMDVKLKAGRVLVVTERELAASDWPYHAVGQEIDRLLADLAGVLGLLTAADPPATPPAAPPVAPQKAGQDDMFAGLPPAVAVASALPQIVGAAADVAGYFQSDFGITGRAFQLKIEPAVAAIVGALRKWGVTSVVDGFHVLPDTDIMKAHKCLRARHWEVVAGRLGLEQRRLGPATAEAEQRKADLARRQAALTVREAATPPDEAKRLEAERLLEAARLALQTALATQGNLQRLVEVAKAVEKRCDDLAAAVTKVPEGGGLPPLGRAALRSALHTASPELTHLLYVSIATSGGETQVRQRRFLAPVVRYVGGCVLSVVVAKKDGTVVYGNSFSAIGQLTYRIKDGELGELKEVTLS